MKHYEIHDNYLDELVRHLEYIDENRRDFEWIMKDGIWMPERDSRRENTFPDLILMAEEFGVPAELKKSTNNRGHARQQLYSGRDYIVHSIGKECDYGKFVTYGTGRFEYEIIEFP